jgi:hypothetical protein
MEIKLQSIISGPMNLVKYKLYRIDKLKDRTLRRIGDGELATYVHMRFQVLA